MRDAINPRMAPSNPPSPPLELQIVNMPPSNKPPTATENSRNGPLNLMTFAISGCLWRFIELPQQIYISEVF